MDAQEKHWIASLCGILSWFICKAPKGHYDGAPSLPTPIPLQVCDRSPESGRIISYSFEGACYFAVSETVSWHRAKMYCADKGANLVSIHSDEEIGFLLKLLHESAALEGNRVWIGLNALGADGSLRWSDWTPLDFTYFNVDEPNNDQNQEKCCNMYIGNGLWNDENCNAPMGFICKRMNETSGFTVPPSPDIPSYGNCKKGWINRYDRCYYLGGIREQDRVNWTQAFQICDDFGGYLTSIRDEKDQAFLTFLIQSLHGDAWIGLHDTIQANRYYWVDNSEILYTKWSPGEPSLFGVKEDCVMMQKSSYGMWRDVECSRKLGYICQSRKDPNLEPEYNRGLHCLHPEGWLKLDNMCFKMFVGNDLSWIDAENACKKEGGNLVSIHDKSILVTVVFLASEIQQSFWIGLRYKESEQRFGWLNGFPMTVSAWDKNEPSFMTEGTCYASTSEGYWKKASCDNEMPYVCQISAGKKPVKELYTGACPPTSNKWINPSGSNCYILDKSRSLTLFSSVLECFKYGSYLASIHSLEELESLKSIIGSEIKSVWIGLLRNANGGYGWADLSPVDFVNWDEGQPLFTRNEMCVQMATDTMTWRTYPCDYKIPFICMINKTIPYSDDPESAKHVDDSSNGPFPATITAVTLCVVIIIVVIAAAAIYFFRSSGRRLTTGHNPLRQQSVSFENALYNVDRSSMEFRDEEQRT